MKLLIIDDEPHIRLVIRFTGGGRMRVDEAADGQVGWTGLVTAPATARSCSIRRCRGSTVWSAQTDQGARRMPAC